MPAELAWSDGRDRQADAVTLAERSDRLKGHVAGSLDRPLVGLLEQEGADEASDGRSHNVAALGFGLRPCGRTAHAADFDHAWALISSYLSGLRYPRAECRRFAL